MAFNQTVPCQPSDPAADLRADDQLIDDVGAGLSGSLNLRRTALRLLTMIRPRLADWGMVVLPGDRPGSLALVGGDFYDVHGRGDDWLLRVGADPEVLCEAIERDVLEYLDGRQHDDIALLAVTCGE